MPVYLWIALGLGALVLLERNSSASSSSSAPRLAPGVDYDPSDPANSWYKALEQGSKDLGAAKPDTSAEEAAWIDFAKKNGHVAPPPEIPIDPKDIGMQGDLGSMPRAMQTEVVNALYDENDIAQLFGLAEHADQAGFPLAANRLRHKAFRIMP